MFKPADLFDLAQTEHAVIFAGCSHAWDALKIIDGYLASVARQNPPKRFPGASIGDRVLIGEGTVVEPGASELKNALLLNGAQVPHFNYVGDSILGHKAHLGAGVKISNLKMFPGNITVEMDGVPFDTGLRKFGALLGDGAEAGCNAVLNPGSILGRGAVIYPNVFWRGILPANMIAKNKADIEVVVKRPRES